MNWGMEEPERFTGETSLKSTSAHLCSTVSVGQGVENA